MWLCFSSHTSSLTYSVPPNPLVTNFIVFRYFFYQTSSSFLFIVFYVLIGKIIKQNKELVLHIDIKRAIRQKFSRYSEKIGGKHVSFLGANRDERLRVLAPAAFRRKNCGCISKSPSRGKCQVNFAVVHQPVERFIEPQKLLSLPQTFVSVLPLHHDPANKITQQLHFTRET